MKLGFLLFALPFLAMIAIASFAVFKTGTAFGVLRSPIAKQMAIWFLALMPIILMATMAIGNKVYSAINAFLYTAAAAWLPILLYLFISAIVLSLISLTATGFGWEVDMRVIALGAAAIVGMVSAYGIINAATPRVVTFEIDSPALREQWSDKKIVLFSDTHIGIVRGKNFIRKIVDKINTLEPDIVFIAGDLIDGPVFDYSQGLSPLHDLHSTFGVIYTPGNHEGYNTEPEKFYPAIKPLVTTLVDSTLEVNNTAIVGLDYRQEDASATSARLREILDSTDLPSIALLHDPTNAKALQDAGVSLVLSGHTHCGQFFPINLIVKRIYKEYVYGINEREAVVQNAAGEVSNIKSTAVTTCGIGTAMSPLRLGTRPEIVILRIK